MKLLAFGGESSGSLRAMRMLAAGGVLVAVLWMMSDPPAQEAIEVADAASPRARAPADAMTPAFAARTTSAGPIDLFHGRSWYIAPPPPPVVETAPPPPAAPPLPFTILGSYASGSGEPVFFLVKGDSVYDVRIGDVIDNTYSVDSMSNGQLQFTYLPLKIGQSLPVGSAP